MDISIIILTFNAKEITLKMIESLKRSLLKSGDLFTYEVIVVDNDSTDGLRQELEAMVKDDPWFTLVKNVNNGFAAGNNLGVKNSNPKSKYILFLNPDIVVEENSISEIYKYMEGHEDVGLATCRIDLWSGGIDWDCHRGFPTPWRSLCYFLGLEKHLGHKFPKLFGGYHLLDRDLDETHEIEACLGAFMMIRRSVGEKIDWWPKDYFMNGEDIDLCYQIKVLQDQKIMYVPTARIIHYKGATKGTKKESSLVTKASSDTKKKQLGAGIEAMEIFYRKYYESRYPKILNWFVYLGIWMLHKKRIILGKE